MMLGRLLVTQALKFILQMVHVGFSELFAIVKFNEFSKLLLEIFLI